MSDLQLQPAAAATLEHWHQMVERKDLGELVQRYVDWQRDVQKNHYSSIHNYVNGLVMITKYVYDNFDMPEETLALELRPLTMLIRLRGQASKEAKQDRMFNKRVCSWISWEEVQQCRIKAFAAVATLLSSSIVSLSQIANARPGRFK